MTFRQRLLTVATAAAAATFVACGGDAPPKRDTKTGCPAQAGRALVIVAVDTSDPLTERQAKLTELLLAGTWSKLAPGDELRVYTLDGRAAEVLPVHVRCKEQPLSWVDGPKTRQAREFAQRQQRANAALADLSRRITSTKGVPSQAKGSRIFEFMQSIAEHTPPGHSAKQLYLLSDMKQFSPRYRSNSQLPATGVALAGFDVSVVVLGEGASLPKVWNTLFAQSGAASFHVDIETLPAGVTQ
jgi:hypothetical protein